MDVESHGKSTSNEAASLESVRQASKRGEALSDEQVDLVADIAISILQSILSCFDGNSCSIDEYEGNEGELILDVKNGAKNGDLAILIGRHGVTLDALQTILTALLGKRLGFHYPVSLDIEGYKSRQRGKVQALARNAAARAKKNMKPVKLPPMNAYERRLVHLTLREDVDVLTHSEGIEPDRYVVVGLQTKE